MDRDLQAWLDGELYPTLFERLDSAFPEFGWTRRSRCWVASKWPGDFPYAVGNESPQRLMVYLNRPHWVKIHGHAGVRFLALVNNGEEPRGPAFLEAVRELARRAGLDASFLDRELSPQAARRVRRSEARRAALQVVIGHAHKTLWSSRGEAARSYLRSRGLSDEDIELLELGLYLDAKEAEEALERAGAELDIAREAGLAGPWAERRLEGYIVVPWHDAGGQPLTLYGRWHEKTPPDGKPKTIALPGEGTKRSPLYLDRARQGEHGGRELVVVEGAFDAALLQARGDSRVVAAMAAQLSGSQLEILARYRVRKVFVCGDPDGGGDKGNIANVDSLTSIGANVYVVPRLPEGLDPDEFVIREGIDGWLRWVERSRPGQLFRAECELEGVRPESPDHLKRDGVARALGVMERFRGTAAGLDREDALRLIAKRTGYSFETLSEVAEDHASRRARQRREQQLDAALRDAQAARKAGQAAGEVLEGLEGQLSGLRAADQPAPPAFSVDRLTAESKQLPAGKRSGWQAVDELGVRFNAGELAIAGARTGHCKTTFLVNLLVNWLEDEMCAGELLLLYSAEEPEVRIYHRLLANLTARAGEGWTTNEVLDWLRDPASRGEMYGWPDLAPLDQAQRTLRSWEDRLMVIHRPRWNIDELADHARLLGQQREVGCVLVDYLQRIPPPAGSFDRRDIEVSQVGRRLKELAIALSAPVVAGAQINREVIPHGYAAKIEGKSYHEAQSEIRKARPSLHHLREGGSEQEADLVLGLLSYAADYRSEARGQPLPDATLLEVGALKNRYGDIGTWAQLALEGQFSLIRDPLSYEEEL